MNCNCKAFGSEIFLQTAITASAEIEIICFTQNQTRFLEVLQIL